MRMQCGVDAQGQNQAAVHVVGWGESAMRQMLCEGCCESGTVARYLASRQAMANAVKTTSRRAS